MGIDLGGADVGMAQLGLDHPEFGPRVQLAGGEAVAHGVRCHPLGDPSGLGGISLFIYYLTKKGHSPSEATSVTAMNSVVSITSHLLLLLLALDIGHTSIKSVFKGKTLSPAILLILVVAICLAIIILKLKPRLRQKVQQLIQDVWRHILNYRHQPLRVLLGLISAGLVTVFYVCAFYTCAHAMGLPLGFAQAFLIYTLGILLGAAALTPGGLGGLEAGLVTGLVAFGYSTATAFAVVIIYRLITFWLPILPGYLSFWLMRKHQVI